MSVVVGRARGLLSAAETPPIGRREGAGCCCLTARVSAAAATARVLEEFAQNSASSAQKIASRHSLRRADAAHFVFSRVPLWCPWANCVDRPGFVRWLPVRAPYVDSPALLSKSFDRVWANVRLAAVQRKGAFLAIEFLRLAVCVGTSFKGTRRSGGRAAAGFSSRSLSRACCTIWKGNVSCRGPRV
jgi:hypothetical protein